MKTLTLEETHQLLNNLQLLNVCSQQFNSFTNRLKEGDPIRIAATSLIEGAEDFKDIQLQIDPSAFEKAQSLFGELVTLQAAMDAQFVTH
ncbi:hypothetical protein [Vibrio coralliilyticus]|uniref:hypothetical protein n=1 Tax=Vibrio coralliilyticus TaxID=190893 RepID=UPI0015602C08|nr:hypothetical protein [Vibrio coralliilyticus]NRF28269.1 hypothetical protein [Vibrio coralliilyticus]NRF51920.1 hypothetical protein [Vibrio coralliilyticus]NRG03905.1 hypothetical protein [Vibrio coralliilyticus]